MRAPTGPFPIARAIAQAQASMSEPLAPDALPEPPPADRWVGDVLGHGHEARTLPLGEDDEGEVVATLVRYRSVIDPASVDQVTPVPAPRFTVLYLHGWSDYLLNHEIGPFWARNAGAFYGLDLRKYGRSLRAHQSPGYIEDLTTYDEDLAAAIELIEQDHPGLPLVLMAHSTGGLTASLWAHRNRGKAAALVLVAPWLETQGSSVMRTLSLPVIAEVAKAFPKRVMPNPDLGYYSRSIQTGYDGEWTVVPAWRPWHSFPARYGWAAAVLRGHTQVAEGLDVGAPVLLVRSAHSHISPQWDETMLSSDIVLDVDDIARRALRISDSVTVATLEGALHDVLLSRPEVRERAYEHIGRWAGAYLP